ncbi:MAG TPA: hypothetical protein VKE24_12865, partial [Candidatus Acidoferrales bacterium]|nr:hypothetical protein [Candidatus Acidoferrales bacterium]
VVAAVGMYILWTYLVVHYWGIAAGLPWAQYDESWSLPTSAVALGLAAVLYLVLFRKSSKLSRSSRASS